MQDQDLGENNVEETDWKREASSVEVSSVAEELEFPAKMVYDNTESIGSSSCYIDEDEKDIAIINNGQKKRSDIGIFFLPLLEASLPEQPCGLPEMQYCPTWLRNGTFPGRVWVT